MKKLLSLLLAASMFLSVVPAMAGAEEDDIGTYNYDFTEARAFEEGLMHEGDIQVNIKDAKFEHISDVSNLQWSNSNYRQTDGSLNKNGFAGYTRPNNENKDAYVVFKFDYDISWASVRSIIHHDYAEPSKLEISADGANFSSVEATGKSLGTYGPSNDYNLWEFRADNFPAGTRYVKAFLGKVTYADKGVYKGWRSWMYGMEVGYPSKAMADDRALAFSDLTSEPQDGVMHEMILPSTGEVNGSYISWESETPEVFEVTGDNKTIIHDDTFVEYTAPAKLKATIRGYGELDKVDVLTKEFEITVMRNTDGWTADDFNEYEMSFYPDFASLSDQPQQHVAGDIALPDSLPGNAEFTWSVSDTKHAVIDGSVIRFTLDKAEAVEMDIILTCNMTLNGQTATKERRYPIRLLQKFGDSLLNTYGTTVNATSGKTEYLLSPSFLTYWESLPADAKPEIRMTFPEKTKASSIMLCEHGDGIAAFTVYAGTVDVGKQAERSIETLGTSRAIDESRIEWKELYKGTTLGDKKRELIPFDTTEAYYYKVVIDEKTTPTVALYNMELYASAASSDDLLQADLDAIALPTTVKSSFTLPTRGENGSAITWISDNSSAVSNTGSVSRSKNDTYATLTATATMNGSTKQKTYPTIKVLGTGSSSGGGGGSSSSGNGNGNGNFLPFVPPEANPSPAPSDKPQSIYTDLATDHWAYSYIKKLTDNGFVIGAGGAFRPEANITREEFLKMLLSAAKIEPSQNATEFSDVNPDEWYAPYIAAALESGLVQGVSEDTFGVGMPITRQDMAVMAARLLASKNVTAQDAQLPDFADKASVAEYAVEAVATLASLGVVGGNDAGEFLPANNTSRAEASKIVCTVYDLLNK